MIKNGTPVTVETDSKIIDEALLYTLPDSEIAQISEWVKKNIRAADRNYSGYTSYGLKHELERDTGIYLTNDQFKHAMLLAGFEPNDPDALNWDFNIVLTKTIIENPNPLFNWLKQYEKEDSMIGDFARDTIADRDFPAMADYKIIRRYLERCHAYDSYIRCFETAWERWEEHKRMVKTCRKSENS